jgi:hypothetical protein
LFCNSLFGVAGLFTIVYVLALFALGVGERREGIYFKKIGSLGDGGFLRLNLEHLGRRRSKSGEGHF